jgi:large subunit ribosomal protein L25
MKTSAEFVATLREGTGKGVARALRRQGLIPAVIYSREGKPQSFSLPTKETTLAYHKGGFFNNVVTLSLGKDKIFALPKAIQLHPVTDVIEHVDFLEVNDKSVVRVQVPVRLLNTDRCIGIKRGGSLNVVRHTIELSCTPANIPSHIEIDMLAVNIGDSIHINSIKLPEGTKPTIARNFTIVAVAGRASKDADAA